VRRSEQLALPISAAVARRLGCDAQMVAITEREGLPIDVGRSRRLFTKPQRRALQARDLTCRFPAAGCRLGGPISTTSCPGSWAAPPTELRFETARAARSCRRRRGSPPTSGGTAQLRQLAKEHGHQIGAMTPWPSTPGSPVTTFSR
jgi:Domain of unknown function (DUF222)